MTACPEAGAVPDEGGTTFRAWATRAGALEVRLYGGEHDALDSWPMRATDGGWFEARVDGAGPGTLYKFVLDGRERPDPYARFLPFGVHGPAEVVRRVRGAPFSSAPPLDRYVVYELHVGTFTPEGTYAAAAERIGPLAELGVTALELMPVSAFPGGRGWGYDGVAHFAPFAPYGRPEALRALVERAHTAGLAVLLDVVYNHFGPRGNYLGEYAAEYFAADQGNPWGSAPDFRVPAMRRYVVDNARMWFDDYGFDGLRLDAVHTIRDPSPVHVLRELRDLASSYRPAKLLVGEDDRNDPAVVTDLGLDAVWADDFHHQMRVLLTGERDGYYGAYEPTLGDLARVIERGWLFEGQRYPPWDQARGKPAGDLEPKRFVYCVENHDQVGNRAFGTRLDADAGPDALRAATAVLLFLPMTPLLFMGQEWGCSSPFLYFTDHDPEYGPAVSKGRRAEFGKFSAFADERARDHIPDPQSPGTFERSKLRWDERDAAPHRASLEATRAMLKLRRDDAVMRSPGSRSALRARVEGDLLVVERRATAGRRTLVANLSNRRVDGAQRLTAAKPLIAIGDVAATSMGPFAVGVWAS